MFKGQERKPLAARCTRALPALPRTRKILALAIGVPATRRAMLLQSLPCTARGAHALRVGWCGVCTLVHFETVRAVEHALFGPNKPSVRVMGCAGRWLHLAADGLQTHGIAPRI